MKPKKIIEIMENMKHCSEYTVCDLCPNYDESVSHKCKGYEADEAVLSVLKKLYAQNKALKRAYAGRKNPKHLGQTSLFTETGCCKCTWDTFCKKKNKYENQYCSEFVPRV